MSTRGRPEKGMKLECPKCGRYVGYWPDKLDYHVGHLMRHRTGQWCGGEAYGPWCDGKERIG